MEGKVRKAFKLEYELDILSKKIRINEHGERELKDFVAELKNSDDFLAKLLLSDIRDTALTQMRVMAWSGMDIKEWLAAVGLSEER